MFPELVAASGRERIALWQTFVLDRCPMRSPGQVDLRTSSYTVRGTGENRMIVYLPASPADAAKIDRLRRLAAARRASPVPAAS
jgi:hypothetical protein